MSNSADWSVSLLSEEDRDLIPSIPKESAQNQVNEEKDAQADIDFQEQYPVKLSEIYQVNRFYHSSFIIVIFLSNDKFPCVLQVICQNLFGYYFLINSRCLPAHAPWVQLSWPISPWLQC